MNEQKKTALELISESNGIYARGAIRTADNALLLTGPFSEDTNEWKMRIADAFSIEQRHPGTLLQNITGKNFEAEYEVDDTVSDLFFSALALGGLHAIFEVGESKVGDMVTVADGLTLKFISTQQEKRTLTSAKFLIVDGAIESVSEVDRAFQYSSATRDAVVIVAHTMHPDVFQTAHVNNARGTTFVYPMTFLPEALRLNDLHDLCEVTKIEPVTAATGQLVSSWDPETAAAVKDVILAPDGTVTFASYDCRRNAKQLVTRLISRLRECNDGTDEILTSRIRNLSTRRVKIDIKSGPLHIYRRGQLDKGLRVLANELRKRRFCLPLMKALIAAPSSASVAPLLIAIPSVFALMPLPSFSVLTMLEIF